MTQPLNRPEGMTDLQFAQMKAAYEQDERLDIWRNTVFMAQGLIEAAELAKELFDYGDERVEHIVKKLFRVCLAHLSVPTNDEGPDS